LLSYAYSPTITLSALKELYGFIKTLILPFILVSIMLIAMENKKSQKLLEKAINARYSALLFILAGMLSMGSIYIVYPLLQSLKKKGASYAHIAAFLYARAVKIPLIPLMAYYFSLEYAFIFTAILFLFSLLAYYTAKIFFS